MSLNVKCNAAVGFLLVPNSKHLSISRGLAVIRTWKKSLIKKSLISFGQKMQKIESRQVIILNHQNTDSSNTRLTLLSLQLIVLSNRIIFIFD